MSPIRAYERAMGTPVHHRAAVIIATAAITFSVLAVVAIGYVLPVGFELSGWALLAAQAGIAVVGAGAVGVIAVRVRAGIRRRALLWMLCAELDWAYTADISDRAWGGSIDEQIERSARTSSDHVDARRGDPPFDATRRVFTVGDGEGATVHSTLAVRVPLAGEAPRIVLRARSGAGALSVLPRAPIGRTLLRLEGGFSDVFDVFVPPGYEADALYVLTPDLMAILWDAAPEADLEIVDGILHVYLPGIDLTDSTQLGRFLAMVGALHERFGRQTLRYRDERAPALDADAYRRQGDTLSVGARTLPTRTRIWPVVTAVLAPLVPVLIAIVWTWTTR